MRNKSWTLKAELRRYRTTRLVAASDGLRRCFFWALTQVEHYLLEQQNLEWEISRPRQTQFPEEEVRWMRANQSKFYNQEISKIKADARAHVAFLDGKLVRLEIREGISRALALLSQKFDGDIPSTKVRIELFDQMQPKVMSLLNDLDKDISNAIGARLEYDFKSVDVASLF